MTFDFKEAAPLAIKVYHFRRVESFPSQFRAASIPRQFQLQRVLPPRLDHRISAPPRHLRSCATYCCTWLWLYARGACY
jgi:hypothetical protein